MKAVMFTFSIVIGLVSLISTIAEPIIGNVDALRFSIPILAFMIGNIIALLDKDDSIFED